MSVVSRYNLELREALHMSIDCSALSLKISNSRSSTASSRVSAKLTDRVPQANKKIRLKLKSDAALQAAINKGLHCATQCFVAEYTAIDEDLVTAIGGDPTFWQLASVRGEVFLEIVQYPTAHPQSKKDSCGPRFPRSTPRPHQP